MVDTLNAGYLKRWILLMVDTLTEDTFDSEYLRKQIPSLLLNLMAAYLQRQIPSMEDTFDGRYL